MTRPNTTLSNGQPVEPGFDAINPATGQQKHYVVLSAEERAKGFVRPVRRSYIHVGERPRYPTRELTPEEHERYDQYGYIAYEKYPAGASVDGCFWTQKRLESGCGGQTTMAQSIAETYARDPKFYGATFCMTCSAHLPVAEFVWLDNPDQRLGS